MIFMIKETCAICGLNQSEATKLQTVCYWLIRQCMETNADEMVVHQKGVTKFKENIGDWEITVKKVSKD